MNKLIGVYVRRIDGSSIHLFDGDIIKEDNDPDGNRFFYRLRIEVEFETYPCDFIDDKIYLNNGAMTISNPRGYVLLSNEVLMDIINDAVNER